MEDFTRVWNRILTGSLRSDWQSRHVAEDLMKICDRNGVLDMTPEAISEMIAVPLHIVTHALGRLSQPDPSSRSQACEGRFLIPLEDEHGHARPWGWLIVNYEAYRAKKSDDAYRSGAKDRMRALRARRATPELTVLRNDANKANSANTSDRRERDVTVTQHSTELELDREQEQEKEGGSSSLRSSVADSPQGETSAGGSTDPPPISSTSLLELPTKAGTPEKARPGPPFRVTEEMLQEYQRLYPTLDVAAELRGMRAWCLGQAAKPRLGKLKVPEDVPEFIRNWLDTEAKKRAGLGSGRAAATRAGPPTPARAAPGDDAISQHLRKGKR